MSLDKRARVESDTRSIEESEDLSGRDKELLLNLKRDLKLVRARTPTCTRCSASSG